MRKFIKYWTPFIVLGLLLLAYFLLQEGFFPDEDSWTGKIVLFIIPFMVFPLSGIFYLKTSHRNPDYFYPLVIALALIVIPHFFFDKNPSLGMKILSGTGLAGLIVFYSLRFFYKRKKHSLDWLKWLLVITSVSVCFVPLLVGHGLISDFGLLGSAMFVLCIHPSKYRSFFFLLRWFKRESVWQ